MKISIDKFILFFRNEIECIKLYNSELHQKILYVALLDTLARVVYSPHNPSERFKKFIRNFSEWKDMDRVSVIQLKHRLDPLRFHGLRHTSATLLNAKGLDIASISRRLGHSTKMTTLNIYTHAFANTDHVAAQMIDGIISRKPETVPSEQSFRGAGMVQEEVIRH